MSKRNVKTHTIEITEFAYNKLMSWGQALDEVAFLGVGKENLITDAVRLMNVSSAPRNYFDYSKNEFGDLLKFFKSSGLEVLCMGHSHPNTKYHLKYPSKSDWRFLPKLWPQIILFPDSKKVLSWNLNLPYQDLKGNALLVKIK